VGASAPALSTQALRTSPRYDLVLYDRLEGHEREALAELTAQPAFYGILRRRAALPGDAQAQSLRAVDRETALLLLTLREPGPLPSYVRDADPSCDGIRRLVLDGFVEVDAAGSFVSGPEAAAVLWPAPVRAIDGASRLGRLSRDAIAYGAALEIDDRSAMAMRLYGYNRLPLSAAHAAKFPDAAAVLDALAPASRLREQRWSVTTAKGSHWINFGRATERRTAARRSPDQASYKLYVSPLPSALSDAFPALQDALIAFGVRHFKVAGTAAGLLRPDKLVAYFDSRDTLLAVADALTRRLHGLPAQGVPFTAAIDAEGLLSWGVDPPTDARPLSWQPQQSWRSWITSTLAGALLDGRQHPVPISPAEFAVQRLSLEGVDVDRWAPAQTLWRDAALVRG